MASNNYNDDVDFKPDSSSSSAPSQDFSADSDFKPDSNQSGGPSAWDSIKQGVVHGGVLGFDNALVGAQAKLQGGDYTQARNAQMQKNATAKTAHPILYAVGEGVGGIPAALGGAELAGGAIAGGALVGGINALGNSSADIANQGMQALPQAAKDVAIGTGLGAGLGAAGEAIGGSIAGGIQDTADRAAIKSLGAKAKDFRGLISREQIPEMAEYLRNSGVLKPGMTVQQVHEALQGVTDDVGGQLSEALAGNDPVGNAADIANAAQAQSADELQYIPGGPQTQQKFTQYLQNEFLPNANEGGDLGLSQAWELRKGIDKGINWDKLYSQMPGNQQALTALRSELQDRILQAAPEEAGDLFKQYNLLETAEKIALKGSASQQANNQVFGLSNMLGAGIGGGLGGGPGAIAGAVATHVLKTRGATTAAVGLDWLAGALQKSPEALGVYATPLLQALSRGPDALAAANYVLSQQSPVYRQMAEKLQGAQPSSSMNTNPGSSSETGTGGGGY
jgi:hypothetical protein